MIAQEVSKQVAQGVLELLDRKTILGAALDCMPHESQMRLVQEVEELVELEILRHQAKERE